MSGGRSVVLWGATGQAIVLHELLESQGHRIVAVFDNNEALESPFADVPIYHGETGFADWRRTARVEETSYCYCVAVGGERGRDRLRIGAYLDSEGLQPMTAIHPRAFVAADASIGEGGQVAALAAVCARARLGRACIVNTSASVDHECVLGDGVHIGPGATLAGCVHVGDCSFVGSGAVVLPRVRIGSDTVVGAGAVVNRDLPDGAVAYGNPARVRDSHNG